MTDNKIKNDIFIFRYDPDFSFEGMFKEFWDFVDNDKSSSVEANIIRSNSIEALTTSMSKNRLQMFKVLVEKKPSSLTELSQLLQKDYTIIRKDAKMLEGMGLIKLENVPKTTSNKSGVSMGYKTVKPIALYKRIVFDFPIMETTPIISKKVPRSPNLHV
jgi:predicted transcriptional regulator